MNDVGLFLSRLAVGGSMAAHGAQKAFGSFDGPGPQGAAAFLESLGFQPGGRFAAAAAWTEIGSGLLIALGLGGPIGPGALISTMLVAQTSAHAKNGYFAQKNGMELGVIYSAGALALASAGYGRFSLDEMFGWQRLREPSLTAVAVIGGLAVGYLVLGQRTAPGETAENLASDDAHAPGDQRSTDTMSAPPA
jgi:putative oxidoreductase